MENPTSFKSDFGRDFIWGVASSAYQIEGAYEKDGKGWSIWDDFTNRKKRVKYRHTGNSATDFYHRYPDDLRLIHELGIPNFRYSISWPRVIPKGKGQPNQAGIDFYNRLIDKALNLGIRPWLTLYHWDLPLALEQKGGWSNRSIIGWFLDYVDLCTREFGDRVKHWMVLNEPSVFTGAGYMLGMHAPGKMGLNSFLPAFHHAMLAQSEGGRLVKYQIPDGQVGTTFSCTPIDPYEAGTQDERAAERVHALVNRMSTEPLLGKGYPLASLPFLQKIQKYMQSGDEERLPFDFDFWGIQCYTREVVQYKWWIPYLKAKRIKAKKRNRSVMANGWEVNHQALYRMLHFFNQYDRAPLLYVTENGMALHDNLANGRVQDDQRIYFIKQNLKSIQQVRNEGVNVNGYFVWTITDNFEWAEGYEPRFGLVYVDFETQERVIKESGYWFKEILTGKREVFE